MSSTEPLDITAPPRAYAEVIEGYLEELGFLEIQRRMLLFSHEITPPEFSEHQERIRAQVAGLLDAGEQAHSAVERTFEMEEPWEVYAAARAWLEISRPAAGDVVTRLETAPQGVLPAWTEALRRSGQSVGLWPESLQVRAVLLAACPWSGSFERARVNESIAADSAGLRRAAARAVGAGSGERDDLIPLLDDEDPEVRAVALWGSCLREPGTACQYLRQRIGIRLEPFSIRALGLFGQEHDRGLISDLCQVDDLEIRDAALSALEDLECQGGNEIPGNHGMLGLWRKSLLEPVSELAWLRREVPAAFFSAVIAEDMRPGE